MKNRSIGFRLSAWYALVFACGLAAFSVATWFAMRASIYHAVDEELRDRVRGVQSFMEHQISALAATYFRYATATDNGCTAPSRWKRPKWR